MIKFFKNLGRRTIILTTIIYKYTYNITKFKILGNTIFSDVLIIEVDNMYGAILNKIARLNFKLIKLASAEKYLIIYAIR